MSAAAHGWDVVAASVRGSAHVRAGTASEDACGTYADDEVVVAVVADGHGSERCFRSSVGSQRAAAIGLRLLREAATADQPAAFIATVEDDVGPALIDEWRQAVLDHASAHPLTPEERVALHLPAGEEPTDATMVMVYGTTFAGIVVHRDHVAAVQIGDGDVVVVAADGQVRRPVPSDVELVGNVTTSLAGAKPRDARTWVSSLSGEPLSLAWVSTDGFGGAYASSDWYLDVGAQLHHEHQVHGPEIIASKLEGWLREPADVAGDDATMAIVLAPRTGAGNGGDA